MQECNSCVFPHADVIIIIIMVSRLRERRTPFLQSFYLSILCGLSIARAEIQGAKFGSISYVMDTELETVMSPAEIGVDMGGAPSATFSCLAAS